MTVWLSANQMASPLERDEKTIRKHINNVFNEQEVDKENNTQKMRVVGVTQLVPFYSLDVIISVASKYFVWGVYYIENSQTKKYNKRVFISNIPELWKGTVRQ